MSLYRSLLRPLLFRSDAERMHDLAVRVGSVISGSGPARSILSAHYGFDDPRLRTEVAGIEFRNPIGLAAGWDKNGRSIGLMEAIGFGHVEIGSVSAEPSAGNPRPRLWRLPEDRGLRVHYGLPNEGAERVAARLAGVQRRVPLGVNIVSTNRGAEACAEDDATIRADYVRSVEVLQDSADYLCLNLSCPNTAAGREHFREGPELQRLLEAIAAIGVRKPVILKMPPGAGVEAIEGMLEAVEGFPFVSGFSINLPPGLPAEQSGRADRRAVMRGAVSGKPAEPIVNASISNLYQRMDRGRFRIIGAGGVFTAEDAFTKIRLGASLVQLFTGLVYEGPGLVRRILEGLCTLADREGFRRISDAVGTAHGGLRDGAR